MECFNFCHHRLNPTVSSSVVSAEGYEVTNLISNDKIKTQTGFMAYHTINPPVDVTFNFICKINISHIVIWPQVGNQKSSGFQVYANSRSDSEQSFANVGTGFLQKEPGIVFYHNTDPTNSQIREFMHQRLYPKQNSLCAIQSLQIRIVRTRHSSVPALNKVEIWGLPSVSCPKDVRMNILALWTQRDEVMSCEQIHKKEKTEENALRSTAKALVSSNFEIPEDFLDPITCEVMILPFTLPCGKVVDKITLEKHENHEANWGRSPSDPFTGRLFTPTFKPIFDVALKARIDKFLVDHSHLEELMKVPRTVGRKSRVKENHTIIAKLPSEKSNVNFPKSLCSTSNENSEPSSITKVSENKRKQFFSDVCNEGKGGQKKSEKKVKLQCEPPANSKHLEQEQVLKASLLSCDNQTKRSHEEVLNDSLDAALKNALSNLPSFTNFKCTIENIENKCHECGVKEVLYLLPCQHFLCRLCLTEKTNNKSIICLLCNTTFDSSCPVRYHS